MGVRGAGCGVLAVGDARPCGEGQRVGAGARVTLARAGWNPPPPAQVYISEPGVVSNSPLSNQVFRPERIMGQPP
jgi:hypothetical protein